MTILPKKKGGLGGPKQAPPPPEGESVGSDGYQLAGQASTGGTSPSRWGSPASGVSGSDGGPSVGEKRQHSPPLHHPTSSVDYDDSLDGAPAAKRVRGSTSATAVGGVISSGKGKKSGYGGSALVSGVSAPSCSSRMGALAEEEEEEDLEELELEEEGYNSEDEYSFSHVGVNLTEEEWAEKDRRFEMVMRRKGYVIKQMGEDGACLFRAVADQLYGDQEMHRCVRAQCMDYIERNADYFSQYVTEPFEEYVRRKRLLQVHGNHLEIQALSELYNRPIHIYCYSPEPINIFQAVNRSNQEMIVPIRLCYHRAVHYNSLIDPAAASIGIGLGLPGLKPGCSLTVVREAVAQNDNILTEQQMLRDKIQATDWEATNEAIEEQVARESYLQWVQEQEKARSKASRHPPAATVTSGQMSPRPLPSSHHPARQSPVGSPHHHSSVRSSPQPGSSSQPDGRDSPVPGSSRDTVARGGGGFVDHGLGPGFQLRETASYLNGLPPEILAGLDDDWGDDAVLNQVLAASQHEYIQSLQQKQQQEGSSDNKSSD